MTPSKPRDRRVRLVIGAGEDELSTRRLKQAAAPLDGVVCADIVRRYPSAAALDAAVLSGLGKTTMFTRSTLSADRLATVEAWLEGEQTRLIAIAHAGLLGVDLCRRIAKTAERVGAELWLVMGRSLTRGQRPLLSDPAFETASHEELYERLDALTALREAPSSPRRAFPRVPTSDFVTFPADVERLVAPADRPAVHATFNSGHTRAVEWLDGRMEIGAGNAVEFLRDLVADTDSAWEGLALLRGAAMAFFFVGEHLLSVDAETFLAAASPGRTPLDQVTALMLRSYVSTRTPAVGVVALAAQHSWPQIAAINVGDVAPDGSHLTIAGDRVEVPAPARGVLRAHLVLRRRAGASASDAFFVNREGQRTYYTRYMHEVRRLTRDLGVQVGDRAAGRAADEPDNRWARRLGIVVRPLHNPVPTRRRVDPGEADAA